MDISQGKLLRSKKPGISQRLNRALGLMVILLVASAGLLLWIFHVRSQATERKLSLLNVSESLGYHITQMSDSVRGLLLDPKNKAERNRLGEAEKGLKDDFANLDGLQKSLHNQGDLPHQAKILKEFVTGPLNAFYTNVVDQADKDLAAANAYYAANFPAISVKREENLKNLLSEIAAVTRSESDYAFNVVLFASLGILLMAAASVRIMFKQSSAISQPLNRLVSALEQMRQGDFTERLSLDQKDEFGVLSQGLNRLADDLSELVGQVQRSGIQVNTTTTQIAATAKEQQSTSHEIAATTAEIGATSKEISATSKELVKTMNEVNQVSEETATVAGSGQAAIARMEATMRQIMEASGSITAKLALLTEKTTNINSVVTTITKVADQTNLLSLNAAIEAEKAGEYGLGFAVVAMEIRRLADQTAVATYDIEKMVKEMQSAVAAGVMGMDKFSEEVRRGVEEIRQVSTHLAQIIHQVQTLTPRFQTVNEGMHAQATGAQQISETLTQLSEAAQQTAESLRQSNQAIEQLNSAARGLQTSVARFKLLPSATAPGVDGHRLGQFQQGRGTVPPLS
jgi:methyl-accepting chemotaxis protein WspA